MSSTKIAKASCKTPGPCKIGHVEAGYEGQPCSPHPIVLTIPERVSKKMGLRHDLKGPFCRVQEFCNWLAILFFLLVGCHAKQEVHRAPPVYPIKMAPVTVKEAPVFIEALGHVESIISINLLSRIEGELTGIFFEQGQEVKSGDLLFTIDPRPYQASLKLAQATLDQNRANLSLAEETMKRYKILAQDEYYSQLNYETLQTNVAADLALVQQSEANVDSALINLNYCWIYAPINGVIGILDIDYGNLIANDGTSALAVLNQIAPIYVTFNVPETYLREVQLWRKKSEKPLKVLAAFQNFNKESFKGELAIIDNQVDVNTGLIKFRSVHANEDRALWPGQFIRARLILHTIPDAIVIPYSAVQLTQTGPVIFVVKEDSTVVQQPVTLGQRQDDEVIVLKGLQPTDTIVTEGQLNLHTGAKVFVPGARS